MKGYDGVLIGPSKVSGLGVFAATSFTSGALIRRFAIEREITRIEPLLASDDPDHAFMANGKFLLAGIPDRYMNHSCDPSVYVRYVEHRIEVVAHRDVETGDELTLDYLINNGGGNSWPCRCGSARCRGITGGSFFTLPEPFQREYFPLLAEWFVRQYGAEISALRERLGISSPAGGKE